MNTLILENFKYGKEYVDVYYEVRETGNFIQLQKGEYKRESFKIDIKKAYDRFNTSDLKLTVMALLAEGELKSEPLKLTIYKDTFDTWCFIQDSVGVAFDVNTEVVQSIPLYFTKEFEDEDCDTALSELKSGFELSLILD